MNEGNLHKWFKGSKSKDGKSGWVNVVTGGTCASDKPGEGTPKCVSSSKRASMTKAERKSAARRKKAADPGQQSKTGAAKPTYVSTDKSKKVKEEIELTDAYGEPFAVIQDIIKPKPMKTNAPDIESYETYDIEAMTEEDKKGKSSGEKDACYHKVKASASVWPSAYASGRLVQCRKKGAKNYGNSTKKEEFENLPVLSQMQINAMRNAGIEVDVLNEKCWVGYTQKGMKKKGKKIVPNCVPVGEEVEEVTEAMRVPAQNGNVYLVAFTWKGKYMMMKLFFPEIKKPSRKEVQSALDKVYPGSMISRFDLSALDNKELYINVSCSEETEVVAEDDKSYDRNRKRAAQRAADRNAARAAGKTGAVPGVGYVTARKEKETYVDSAGTTRHKSGAKNEETEVAEGAAWTKKSGKNSKGGLNEKGRKSYEKENPGSDLKAPSKKVGNPRRASFCARMKGMRKRQKPSNNTGDDRLSKSLRAWNC